MEFFILAGIVVALLFNGKSEEDTAKPSYEDEVRAGSKAHNDQARYTDIRDKQDRKEKAEKRGETYFHY